MSLGDLAYLSEALRDVFGELCKVGSLQNAEIAKLGGRSWDEVPELQSQAASLLRRLDDVARQAELSAFFGEDHESDSGASSSFDEPKAATIQKWSHYVGEFREGQEFPVGLSDYDSDEDADSVGVDDSASMVGVNNYDDQPVEDHEADISLRSVNASFWKSSGFNWADEASLFDEEFDDERGDEPQYSSSNLVVPELDEDSGHLDTTSESGLSFRSEEMNGRSSVIGSSHDGDAQEKRDVVAVEPVVVTDANRQFFRDRTVSFNYKLMAEYDADTDTEKESSPRKPSPSTFPRRLLHSNLPHLRRTRIDSLPNMGRLVALQE